MLEKATAILAKANLASEIDTANFLRRTHLSENELNELSKKFKSISTEWLIKHLINKYSSGIFQNYLVFIPSKNTLNILVTLLE